jgi:hypothetical protein
MTTKKARMFYNLAESPLQKHVARWIDNYQDHGYDTAESMLNDLLSHGCVSGMVGHLIYYHDTLNFYRRFHAEIDSMYAEAIQEFGADFKLNGWDTDDPLARDTTNKNILAWFGFEETARKFASLAGLDI